MKGIILASGSVPRIYPNTRGVSRQLLPIHGKLVVYYPLSVLMLAGKHDILVFTTPQDQGSFFRLLGDYQVRDPVVQFDDRRHAVSIEEKPLKPKSQYAVTGRDFYDSYVVDIAKEIKPSARGGLKITCVDQVDLERGNLNVEVLGRCFAWLDTSTHERLLEPGIFVETIEERQGFKIAWPEEIAFNNGGLNGQQSISIGQNLRKNSSSQYPLALAGKMP